MAVNLMGIPTCGVACLITCLEASTCVLTNQTCLCLDPAYNDIVTECVMASCAPKDAYTTKNITATNCGFPAHDVSSSPLAVAISLLILQTSFFLMRMVGRGLKIGTWGHDDSTIVLSWILSTVLNVLLLVERHVIGKDAWTLPSATITDFLKIFYVSEVIYSLCLGFTKISICFLYIRIFTDKKFQRVVWGTQIFNFLLIVSFFTSHFLQCRPMSYFWHRWDGEHQGHCFNFAASAYSHAGINIGLDIWMLLLPASQVYNLRMPWRKKFGMFLMFSLGIFITIVSIIRLTTLVHFGKTTNPTLDFYSVAICTILEITVAVIVACMPASRMVITKYAPVVTPQFISSWWKSFVSSVSRSTKSDCDGSKRSVRFSGATRTFGGSSIVEPPSRKQSTFGNHFNDPGRRKQSTFGSNMNDAQYICEATSLDDLHVEHVRKYDDDVDDDGDDDLDDDNTDPVSAGDSYHATG